jgi:hypothetical protein
MDIRHRFVEGAIWVECFDEDKIVAYVKFIMHKDDNLRSASTTVFPGYYRRGLATQMYLHAHNLGYKIRPSCMQSDEGKRMWKGFRKAEHPFVQFSRWERLLKRFKC